MKQPNNSSPNSARKARLAEQLRANLLKRKQQVRSRQAGVADLRENGSEAAETGQAEDKPED